MGEDDRILKCLVVRELIVHVCLIDLVRIAFKRAMPAHPAATLQVSLYGVWTFSAFT
jgi:hypothetical protein